MTPGVQARLRSVALPPPLPGARAPRRSVSGVLLAAGGVLLALVVARAAGAGRLPIPACTFRQLTGHACPSCGGTRSLAALARTDVAEAFAWNPLVAALALGILAAAGLWLADRAMTGGRLAKAAARRVRWSGGTARVVALLVVINWIYLLRTLG